MLRFRRTGRVTSFTIYIYVSILICRLLYFGLRVLFSGSVVTPRHGNMRADSAARVPSLVPLDRGLDDAGRSHEVDGDDVRGALPLAVVPIRDVDVDLVRHFADAPEPVQDHVQRVGCQFRHRRSRCRPGMSVTRGRRERAAVCVDALAGENSFSLLRARLTYPMLCVSMRFR